MGTQQSFSHPLKQTLTGVKEHGKGVTLYRTMDSIKKTADLTIYCVLSQIEDFYQKNCYFPETLYLQVDGGCENANKYLLATMELLVVKRLIREIYVTRLPTGHTHEDIDGVFAVIWNTMKGQSNESLQLYKNRLESKLHNSCLKMQIKDVYVIPNYKVMFEDCIDAQLARLHKEEYTQHQWRFYSVQHCTAFPLGCKTTYRAFSSPKVVEFLKLPPQECVTPIGRWTGLEPITTYCRWYPSPSCDPNRLGVEGSSLLKEIPHFMQSTLPPIEFPAGLKERILRTLNEVNTTFEVTNENHRRIRQDWAEWRETDAPLSDTAEDYVNLMRVKGRVYHVPLKRWLLDKSMIQEFPEWSTTVTNYQTYEPDFEFPELLAAAMNSVVTERNVHPPDPRTYVSTDPFLTERLDGFREHLDDYYTWIASLTVAQLSERLSMRVKYDGIIPSFPGIYTSFSSYFNFAFEHYQIIALSLNSKVF